MKVAFLLPFAVLFSSCGYFSDQSSPVMINITSVENTEEGTLVTFSVDSDNEILYTGVDYRKPDEDFQLFNQGLVGGENPERTVLLSGVDDGLTFFRAFAVTDGLYGYSEEVSFEVVSALPEVPCTVQNNFVRINGASCQVVSDQIRTTTGQQEFKIDLGCNNPSVRITFPRDPTSGVYRTVNSISSSNSIEDKVVEMNFISFNFFQVNPFQDVYVERTSDFTIITFCGLGYRNDPAFVITGRVLVPR